MPVIGERISDPYTATGPGFGGGSVAVNHNYEDADAWRVVRPGGAPVSNAVIRAYVAADYTGGTIDPLPATTATGSDGRWIHALMLSPGDYVVEVYDPASKSTTLFPLTVS